MPEQFRHDSILPYKINPDGGTTSYLPGKFPNGEPDFARTLAVTFRDGKQIREEIIDKPWEYFCEGH